ncbi:hypothetical protein D9M71_755980 [compost metagenome]
MYGVVLSAIEPEGNSLILGMVNLRGILGVTTLTFALPKANLKKASDASSIL